jgi:hypothetical protein
VAAIVVPLVTGLSSSKPSGVTTASGSQHLPAIPADYTCGGCPPAESGPALAADLQVASEVNLVASDLPREWKQVAPPASVSADRTFATIAPEQAEAFARCMGLTPAQEASVATDADQVLNVGSPLFENLAEHIEMSSSVDMVKTASDGASDWSVYASPRYAACAGALYGAISSLGAGPADQPTRLAAASVTVVPMPPVRTGHRELLEISYPPAAPVAGESVGTTWIAVIQDLRVEATVDVSSAAQIAPGTVESLISSVTAAMLARADAAQRGQKL